MDRVTGSPTWPAADVTPEKVYTKDDIHAALLGVTLEAAAPAIAVTLGDAPLDPRVLVLGDCIQARQEILGVMAGMDGMPHLSCFPDSKVHVLDAFHDLRRALLHIEQAITSITDEPRKG